MDLIDLDTIKIDIPANDLIKMELREKVHQFITGQPEVAVKILRVFLSQDNEEVKNKT